MNRGLVDNSSTDTGPVETTREDRGLKVNADERRGEGVGESGGGPGGLRLEMGLDLAGRRARRTGEGSGAGPGVSVRSCLKVKAGESAGGVLTDGTRGGDVLRSSNEVIRCPIRA